MIQLSTIAPDFDSLRVQLEQAAIGFPTWKDRITGATGQTLLEMVAAIGAYSQYAIESSYQESWPDSAKNAEAIYAATNFAGVRVDRRNPSALTFPMVAPVDATTVPPYTQFVGAGSYWFNRTALTIGTSPSNVTLYQGQIVNKNVFGLGTDFQAYVSEEDSFQIGNTDVLLKINNVSVPASVQGLWTFKDLPGVQQFTLPDGRMILLFGNDIYGSKPTANDLCTITYVVTQGLDGNNIVTSGKTINLDGDPTTFGVPTSNPTGGANQSDFTIYKNVTPALFGAFDSVVTANQYKKLPLQYPGVIDALVLSQREINPRALDFMNVMKVCLLTSSPWDDAAWQDFVDYFEASSMYSTRIVREDPVVLNITVNARVYCKNFANLTLVKANCQAALSALFALRQGSIGLDIYKSDIIKAIVEADSNVEYVQLISPTNDLVLSSLSVGAPTLSVIVGGGSLTIGTYDYGIGVTSTLGGSAAPSKWSSINVTQNSSQVSITWPAAPNPVNYLVYGRVTGNDLGLLATVDSSTTTYVDQGNNSPTGTVPSQSTIASYYPNLQSSVLTMSYTSRNQR